MKKYFTLIAIACMASTQMKANSMEGLGFHLQPLEHMTYKVDSMPTHLSTLAEESTLRRAEKARNYKMSSWATKNGQEIKPIKFKDDMTYAGIPLFVAGIIAKSEKASFRQDYNNQNSRTRLLTNFHSEIDNYTQYVPALLAAGLNFAGVEGRSDHGRFLASSAMAYGLMAAIVNPIKYSAKEMRPDGSTRNSWPSGHTATAFVSATILHKEYGLTRSPWYSVAGYGIATATGVMRVLNNRHWVSDVLSGAGIGIISTELAYGFSDLIFKGKHLKRNNLPITADIIEHPSFFNISMGIGLGSRNMTFSGEELGLGDSETDKAEDVTLKFGAATAVGAEGTYFFNKYIGIGGRLRVKSSPIKGWSDVTNLASAKLEKTFASLGTSTDFNYSKWAPVHDITIESDHITEFAADLGLYFNFPLSNRWALGSKLLVGRSIIQDLDVNAHFAGTAIDIVEDGNALKVDYTNPYDMTFDYLTVSGNNTMKYGTGISLTYAYKSNFAWKLFCDYDFTRKHYTMEYDPLAFTKEASPTIYALFAAINDGKTSYSSTIKKNMNSFVLGCAFTISF